MRTPLPKGYELKINTDSSQVVITIGDVIGEGGCCIAYKGEMRVDPHIPVVVKECFPLSLPIERRLNLDSIDNDDYSLVFKNKEQERIEKGRFESRKDMFKRGILHNSRVSQLNETNELFAVGEANHTCYSFSLYSKGEILSDHIKTHFLSIPEITRIVISLCHSIRRYHKAGFIYLDCKPDNIFVTRTEDDQTAAKIIDFDTIIPYEKRKSKKNPCTYSLGWAAPEQMNPNEPVSYKTDVFSIGAVLLWLLTERKPYEVSDHGIDYSLLNGIQENSVDWRSISRICSDADQIVIDLIHNIEKRALAFKQSDRSYGSVGNELDEMIGDLEYLLTEAERDISSRNTSLSVSTNRFKYDSNSTILRGRDEEISLLTDMCNAPQTFCWIGISGAGGTGKSRLAYELSARMIKQYWNVFSPVRFNEYTKNYILSVINNPRGNILICLDYVKQDDEDINDFIKYVAYNLNRTRYKIRLVLIEREKKDIQIDDYDIDRFKYTNDHNGEPFNGIIDLKPLSEDAIKAIIVDYIIRQNPSVVVPEDALDLMNRTLKSVDREYRRPLYAMFIADAWLNNEDLLKWDRNAALNYLLGREMQRLSFIIKNKQYRLNRIEQEKYYDAVMFLYAQASYLGSVFIMDYYDVLREKYNIPQNDEMLTTIMKEFGILGPNQIVEGWVPDLIGEYFCITYLNKCYGENGIEDVEKFIALTIDRDLSAFVRYSDFFYKDFPDIVCNCAWIEVLRNIEFPAKYSFVRKNQFRDSSFLKSISFPGRIYTISAGAFRNCKNLVRIILPSSLETIEKYAFYNCKNLIEVLPEDGKGKNPSVIKIEQFAFQNCVSLENIILPESIQEIGMFAFKNCCSLTAVCITRKIQKLNSSTFSGCRSLKWINFEKTKGVSLGDSCFNGCEQLHIVAGSEKIKAVDRNVFRNCRSLESLSFGKKLEILKDNVFSGCQSLKCVDLSACEITHIPNRLFVGCSSLMQVVLPDRIERIGDHSFRGCENLEEITFKKGLTTIGHHAFSGCQKLKYLEFPESLRIIKSYAFENCTGLSGISFANKPKMVEAHAFAGCTGLSSSDIFGPGNNEPIDFGGFIFKRTGKNELRFLNGYLKSEIIDIPDTCVDIAGVRFNSIRRMKKVSIPNTIEKLPAGVFRDCTFLEEVELPAALKIIPSNAFTDCKALKAIVFRGNEPNTIPYGVRIDRDAFVGCRSLTDLSLPDSLTMIESHTFHGCMSLKLIIIPPNVTSIGNCAFMNCNSLESIKLPNALTVLGKGVFSGCTTLNRVENLENTNLKVLENNVFASCQRLKTLSLPASIKVIKGHAFENCHSLRVPRGFLPNGIIKIEDAVFQGCYSIECLRLPKNIREISKYTFKNCSSLREVSIPDHLTSIGQSAFYHCNSLVDEGINLPSGLETVGISAFAYCSSIKKIRIPDNTRELPADLFKGCSSLEEVLIPEHLQEIPANCFKDCLSLRSVNLHKNLEIISAGAFRNCVSLQTDMLKLPDGLKEVYESAFRYCDGLEKVKIPVGIKKISSAVFEGCAHLKEVILDHPIEKVENYAFSGCCSLEKFPFRFVEDEIGDCAFSYCRSLTSPEFSKNIRVIRTAAFRGCSNIEILNLPNSLTTIYGASFRENTNLRKVIIPETVTRIKRSAFRGCVNLSNVQIKSLEINIQHWAFRGCSKLDYIDIPEVNTVESDAFEGCPTEAELKGNPGIHWEDNENTKMEVE